MTCLHLLTQLSPFDLIDHRANAAWQDYLSQPISPALQTILSRLIDPAPHKRYSSAAAVLRDVETLSPLNQASEGISAATIAAMSAAITSAAIPAVTVFDPATQHWYHLSREPQISNATQKIASFLSSRQAATTVAAVEIKPRDPDPTTEQIVLRSLLAGMGTAIGCFAGFCLFTCLSIIAFGLLPPLQPRTSPAAQLQSPARIPNPQSLTPIPQPH
jgi:serine/threonine protein kinase